MNARITTYTLILSLLVLSYIPSWSQIPIPASQGKLPILIQGATIHVGNGEVIEKGVIIVENGTIQAIGKEGEVKIDKSAKQTIDAKGKHVYPGFINTNNTLGLREIDAVRATRDFNEAGSLNPHVRAMIAYNTESRVSMTVRSNGVLLTQATPRGGRISGQSAIMRLDGWNWEDAAVLESDGVHLNWPRDFTRKWTGNGIKKEKNKKKTEQLKELEQLFISAKAYQLKKDEKDMRLEAMLPIINGKSNLYIHTNSAKSIIESIQFAEKSGAKNIVLVGGREAHLITDFLKEHKIPVILERVHSLPMHEDEDVLLPYATASLLNEKGVKYCLNWSGDMEAMNSRNLPFGAGSTVTYGVDYEKAVRSISLDAAEIIGIDNQYGSLELGKSATLFISEGDALDMRTNKVFFALIDGKEIDLNNHQKELGKKYSEKYGLELEK